MFRVRLVLPQLFYKLKIRPYMFCVDLTTKLFGSSTTGALCELKTIRNGGRLDESKTALRGGC